MGFLPQCLGCALKVRLKASSSLQSESCSYTMYLKQMTHLLFLWTVYYQTTSFFAGNSFFDAFSLEKKLSPDLSTVAHSQFLDIHAGTLTQPWQIPPFWMILTRKDQTYSSQLCQCRGGVFHLHHGLHGGFTTEARVLITYWSPTNALIESYPPQGGRQTTN